MRILNILYCKLSNQKPFIFSEAQVGYLSGEINKQSYDSSMEMPINIIYTVRIRS